MNKTDLIDAMAEDAGISKAAAKKALESFLDGGRLFYIGAGTSGRLGVLDAAECKPTFGVDSSMVQGIIAGGEKALSESIEGAEDKIDDVKKIIANREISSNDIIIGISCSYRNGSGYW